MCMAHDEAAKRRRLHHRTLAPPPHHQAGISGGLRCGHCDDGILSINTRRRRRDRPGRGQQTTIPPSPRFPHPQHTHDDPTPSPASMGASFSLHPHQLTHFPSPLSYPSQDQPELCILSCFPLLLPPPRRSLTSSQFASVEAEVTPATTPPCDSTSRQLSRTER